MSDDDTIQFRDYHEGTDSKTPCPRCGALIVLNATTCQECGVHFRGRAVDFSPASAGGPSDDRPVLRRIAMILLLVLSIIIALGMVVAIGGALTGTAPL